MSHQEAREVARLRQELREQLMSPQRARADVAGLLARLRHAAASYAGEAPELTNEYERWRLRFDVLAP